MLARVNNKTFLLPFELLVIIVSYCDIEKSDALCLVDKSFYKAVNQNYKSILEKKCIGPLSHHVASPITMWRKTYHAIFSTPNSEFIEKFFSLYIEKLNRYSGGINFSLSGRPYYRICDSEREARMILSTIQLMRSKVKTFPGCLDLICYLQSEAAIASSHSLRPVLNALSNYLFFCLSKHPARQSLLGCIKHKLKLIQSGHERIILTCFADFLQNKTSLLLINFKFTPNPFACEQLYDSEYKTITGKSFLEFQADCLSKKLVQYNRPFAFTAIKILR